MSRPDEQAMVLVMTALLTVVSALPRGGAAAVAALALASVTTVAWRRRAPAAASLGVLVVSALALGLAGVGPQQLTFAFAFAVYFLVVSRTPWLRHAGRWRAAGRLDGRIMAAAVAFAAASGVALLAWHALARPNLDDLVRTFVPAWPLSVLVPAAIVFSLLNAALEEAAYRGVVMDALDRASGAAAAVVLQAAAFAALHFQAGFPRGAIGVGLAFVYGVALGILRDRAGGLMAPFITHVLTDVVIVSIVLALARG